MRRILVVANKTLAEGHLLDVLRERVAGGPVSFRIVVPATPPSQDRLQVGFSPAGGMKVEGAESGSPRDQFQIADERLEAGLDLIRALGVPVDGKVGDSNPAHAVDEALKDDTFDEIIISTLPTGLSHWLRADLPSRVQRKHHIPVTTVTPAG